MNHLQMLKAAPTLAAAIVFGLAHMTLVATSGAQDVSVGGNFGSGDNTSSVGASLGGGSGSAAGSLSGPSGTTGNGSLSIGGGNGIAARSSSATVSGTRTNFTSVFSPNNSSGSVNLGSGDTTAGLSFGSTGSIGPGTEPGAGSSSSGIAAAIGNLSTQDHRKLVQKCVSVLAAPQRHNADMVAVCKVLASL
jgi:hypothetical protein